MKQKIKVEVKISDREKIQELMEDTLIQIIIDRIKKFPEEERIYIYDEILRRLKTTTL